MRTGSSRSWRPVMLPSNRTDDLFRVLAAPTRRRILDLLAERGELTVGELAAAFPDLVASGISKHLMELRGAALVRARREGRRQLYRIEGQALAEALAPWLARYEAYWSGALERLRHLAESGPPPDEGTESPHEGGPHDGR